jgi:hypothetical protein
MYPGTNDPQDFLREVGNHVIYILECCARSEGRMWGGAYVSRRHTRVRVRVLGCEKVSVNIHLQVFEELRLHIFLQLF